MVYYRHHSLIILIMDQETLLRVGFTQVCCVCGGLFRSFHYAISICEQCTFEDFLLLNGEQAFPEPRFDMSSNDYPIWWTKEVGDIINEKRRCFAELKQIGFKKGRIMEEYKLAKSHSKKAVRRAKSYSKKQNGKVW